MTALSPSARFLTLLRREWLQHSEWKNRFR